MVPQCNLGCPKIVCNLRVGRISSPNHCTCSCGISSGHWRRQSRLGPSAPVVTGGATRRGAHVVFLRELNSPTDDNARRRLCSILQMPRLPAQATTRLAMTPDATASSKYNSSNSPSALANVARGASALPASLGTTLRVEHPLAEDLSLSAQTAGPESSPAEPAHCGSQRIDHPRGNH